MRIFLKNIGWKMDEFAPSSRKFEIIIEPRAWDPCQQNGRRLVHLALPLPKSLLRRDNWILEAWCSWREGGKARGAAKLLSTSSWEKLVSGTRAEDVASFSHTCPRISASDFLSNALWCGSRAREKLPVRNRSRPFDSFRKDFQSVQSDHDRLWFSILSVRGGKLQTRDTSSYKLVENSISSFQIPRF